MSVTEPVVDLCVTLLTPIFLFLKNIFILFCYSQRVLFKLHSQNAAELIFLRCCPPYLKLHFELGELTNMQKNPSKQTKPQRAPNHTAPGLKSPAFSAHSEEENTERCQKTIFCYLSGSDSARAAPLPGWADLWRGLLCPHGNRKTLHSGLSKVS